jgi:hypothetical protein
MQTRGCASVFPMAPINLHKAAAYAACLDGLRGTIRAAYGSGPGGSTCSSRLPAPISNMSACWLAAGRKPGGIANHAARRRRGRLGLSFTARRGKYFATRDRARRSGHAGRAGSRACRSVTMADTPVRSEDGRGQRQRRSWCRRLSPPPSRRRWRKTGNTRSSTSSTDRRPASSCRGLADVDMLRARFGAECHFRGRRLPGADHVRGDCRHYL